MFKEQYRRDNEKLHAREDLLMEIKARAAREAEEARRRPAALRSAVVRYGAMAAAFVLVLGGAFGVGRYVGMNGGKTESAPMVAAAVSEEPAAGARGVESRAASTAETASGAPLYEAAVDSYEALYALLMKNDSGWITADAAGGLVMEAPAAEEAAEPEAAPAADKVMASETVTDAGAATNGYSETNVQVAGVDEADIVKTDGKYIYYITNGVLVTAAAEAENTKILSKTQLMPEEKSDTHFYRALEMYLYENRLHVLLSGDALLWRGGSEGWRELTCMAIYDVSDPGNPKCIDEIGQTGSYVSSRMTGGRIYLVTQQYTARPLESVPLSFVPALWTNGTAEAIAIDCIRIPDRDVTHTYTVIGSFDAIKPASDRALTAVLGHAGQIYCNEEHLLLAQDVSSYERTQPEPSEEHDGKNVAFNRQRSKTRLTLYRLGSRVEFLAEGEVRGRLLNQFAMDEYKDAFRVVTTVNDWTETIFTDGLDTYEWSDETFNCLYTLDAALNPLGAIENLAENEWVESVRFDGDIAYFVTFRQTDPLFTVDLSDPSDPKLLGALKIPGFSEYLHGFGEGRLLGVGYDADENTGWRQGVKLTMFNTENKADVTELFTKVLSADSTPVGYNHKAILVDVSLGLIAFPADDSYYVFSYSEEEGFVQKGKLQTGHWGTDLRGVRIGDILYICADEAITVISLSDYSVIVRAAYGTDNA